MLPRFAACAQTLGCFLSLTTSIMELHLPHLPPGKGILGRLAALSPIVIAIASLAITLYEAQATREHDRMAVWPRLAQETSDSAGRYVRDITNVGLGPALIRSFEVRLDDTLQHSWEPVVRALVSPAKTPGYFFSVVGPGTVILPGHTLHVLTIVDAALSDTATARDHRLTSRLCYCSLYRECWAETSRDRDPRPVQQCSDADTASMRL